MAGVLSASIRHQSHERSGAVVSDQTNAFIIPRWKPFSPEIPQIPYTFPPRTAQPPRKHAKSRKRKAQPHAWREFGVGADFDQVGLLGQISKADYMEGLNEEL